MVSLNFELDGLDYNKDLSAQPVNFIPEGGNGGSSGGGAGDYYGGGGGGGQAWGYNPHWHQQPQQPPQQVTTVNSKLITRHNSAVPIPSSVDET